MNAARARWRFKTLKFLLALGCSLVLLGLDINAPFEADQEPYYASVIRDVAENGHWLAPVDSYGEICRKPPLYLWLSALVVKAAGGSVNEATTRVVALVAGALLAAETLLVADACLGPAVGWLAYLFLLGSYGFASQAASAQTDMLMALFVVSAVLLASRPEMPKASIWGAGATGLLLGLAILTKGPLALVLSGLVMMLYRGLVGQNPLGLLRQRWVFGSTALACLIGLAWYATAWLSWRQDLLTVHVLQENLGHFFPARFGGTGEAAKPLFFPAAKLLGGALPMSLGTPVLILAVWRSRRWIAARRLLALQVSIVTVVLVFFTLASSKRPVYVLPAYPALAILLAWVFLANGRESVALEERRGYSENLSKNLAESGLGLGEASDRTAMAAGQPPRRTDSLLDYLRDGACVLAALGFAAILVALAVVKFYFGLIPDIGAQLAPTDASYASLFIDFAARPKLGIVIFALTSLTGLVVVIAGLWRGLRAVSSLGVALLSLSAVGLWLGILKPAHADLYTLKGFVAAARGVTGQAPVYALAGEDYQVSFYYKKTVPIWRPQDLAKPGPALPFYVIGWGNDLADVRLPVGYLLKISFCDGPRRPRGQMCLARLMPAASNTSGSGGSRLSLSN